LRGSYQFIGCVFTFSACYYGQRRLYVNGLGRFMAEGYFHPVNAINSRVTGWRAPQRSHQGIGHKPHMHQVVLHGFRQVQGNHYPAFAHA
jgi:hypothetical protein